MAEDTFNRFSQLPTELRERIWRFCLPHRVSETDFPLDFMVYNSFGSEDKLACSLRSTTISNGRPPLLTRVCRESRSVAFETGSWFSVLDAREIKDPRRPREADWESANVVNHDFWQDPVRESAHLNWTPSYAADVVCTNDGHPLVSLAWEAKRLNGSASIMLDYISDSLTELEPFDKPITQPLESIPIPQYKQQDLAALKLLPEWLVVVRVIVIHLDFAQAAKTGLFGLSGDERVRVVDAALPLASQLYEMAETCECDAVISAQDLTQMPTSEMDAMVKRVAFKAYHDLELPKRLRPAIMFRLCTQMCNHSNTLGEERNKAGPNEAFAA